jgi:hypothetical protein
MPAEPVVRRPATGFSLLLTMTTVRVLRMLIKGSLKVKESGGPGICIVLAQEAAMELS